MHSLSIAPCYWSKPCSSVILDIPCTMISYVHNYVEAKPCSVPLSGCIMLTLPAYHHLISYLQQELNAMLLEAAVEDEAALMPPQYQTNYREEYQYSGPPTGQYVSQVPVACPSVKCTVVSGGLGGPHRGAPQGGPHSTALQQHVYQHLYNLSISHASLSLMHPLICCLLSH